MGTNRLSWGPPITTVGIFYSMKKIFAPRIELGTSRVLGERHNQLDHANKGLEYLGFDPSTSSLLRTHASNCANTPRTCATPRGFEPLRSKTTHLAGEPLNHSGKVSFCLSNLGCPTVLSVYSLEKHKNTNTLHVREFNPGCLRDRQK